MKQRRISATLIIAVLALTALLILTALPQAGTAAPAVASLSTNPKRTNESAAAHSFIRSPFVDSSPGTTARVSAALRSSPVMFIENVGQFDEHARFQVRGGMGNMWLAEDAIWVTVLEKPSSPQPPSPKFGREAGGEGHEGQPRKGVNLCLTFPGANPHARIEPFDRLDTVVSYFIGNDPDQWRPNVPVWGGMRYVDLYPGVDLEITSQAGRWTWRAVTDNDATLSQVRLRVEGVDALTLNDAGYLRLATAVGEFALPLMQAVTAEGMPLDLMTAQPEISDGEIRTPFTISASNLQSLPHLPTTQDNPDDLLYSTFLGGSDWDTGEAIVVDPDGSAYVTGATGSFDFPTTAGAFDTSIDGSRNYDAFVVKVNADGTGLAYATFLGGSQSDEGRAIAVDGAGSAYVTGWTASSDFPTTAGAFDRSCGTDGNCNYEGGLNRYYDAFVVKVNADGTELAYATFLGGSGQDLSYAIAVDGAGSAYVTGWTASSDFPTTAGAFDISHNGGYYDAFVVKVNAGGTGLAYATFLGGSDHDYGEAIAVDGAGSAYVTAGTYSHDFPTTAGAFDTSLDGDEDTFVVKVNADGTGLAYATFLGGSGQDLSYAIAVDGAGSVYVAGLTHSSDFPTTAGAFDTSLDGDEDTFVVKVNADGTELAYATFLGGSNREEGYAIAVDGAGSAYVAGITYSFDFPTTEGAFDTILDEGDGAFVVKVNAGGTGLAYATFLEGSGSDAGFAIAVDGVGSAYVTGCTGSSDFPTTEGAFDTSHNGGYTDAFVAKLAMGGGPGLLISHIEVTQATQDESNSVPLVAGKLTFVRVYVDCGVGCTSLPDVTGVLRGYGASGELPDSPLSPVNRSITVYHDDWQNQRDNLHKTLNFTLPSEWHTGTITLTAEINGATRSEVVAFESAQTPNIIYVPIRYKGQSPDIARIRNGSWWAFRVYPASRIDYVPGTTLDWNRCLEKDLLCPFRDRNTKSLLNELTTRYRLVNAYVYGWLPEGTFGGGISNPTWYGGAGKAAFGDDHPGEGPRIFAHEVAHLMGRRHTNTGECGDVDPATDWPYATARIQDYGLDGYGFGWLVSSSSAVKNPDNTYDYMSYCGSLADGNVWTSPWTYEHIYSETLKLQTTALVAHPLAASQPYFIASGLVYTDDTATLDPIWVITSTVEPENPPAGTAYCLEAQDDSGTPLSSHCFDLTFMNYETGEATDVDGFNLMLPYPSGVARIVLKKGAAELAVQSVSANAPVVTVLSPNGGEAWAASGTYTITWATSDADGDPLTYSVLYSPDGSNWMPIGATTTETQLAVNAAELAGSTNTRIRVLASDGVNTSADESDASFTVERKPPQVFIISPEADSATLPDTPVWLEGYAYDLEDGSLGDAVLRWSSSRDGDLGTGAQVLTTLSLGQHTLTFTATDSDGNTATATVQVLATLIEITEPEDSEIVSGNVTIRAATGEGNGIQKVELYLDGVLHASSVISPYTWIWASGLMDNGPHEIQAKAYDLVGGVATSPVVHVVVDNLVEETQWTRWAFDGETVEDLETGPSAGMIWSLTANALYRSMDYGVTWNKTDAGLPSGVQFVAVGTDSAPDAPIYAAGWDEVFVSWDAGETWALDTKFASSLIYLDFIDNTPYAATYSYQVFRRLPTGEWESVGDELDGYVYDVALYQSTLYAGTSEGLYRLTGGVWEPVTVDAYSISLYAPTTWFEQGLKPRSKLQVETMMPSISVHSIVVLGGTIYVGTSGARGVYKSQDGETWIACDVGLTGPYSHSVLKLVASSVGWLFAATTDGVFVSQNQADRWQALDTGLPHTLTGYGVLLDNVTATSLTIIDEQGSQHILGAVFNSEGVWRLVVTGDMLIHNLPHQTPPKAVLIVGPVDPPEHSTTLSYIAWADRLATIMEANGMDVVKVYWPDSTWENARSAISGASIIVYKGHGFGLGDLPEDPTEMVGGCNGFCLVDPTDSWGARLGTQDMLIATSQLADNAIAFLFCCSCAGSSASDPVPVSEALARRRIEAYASTFLRMGARGYFSGVNEESLLEDFFANPHKTLGDLYGSVGGDPEHMYTHILWPDQAVWFDGDVEYGWGRAFVGNPDLTGNQVLYSPFGDLDGNCVVDIADILLVASRWRTSCAKRDPDNDPDTPNYEARYDLDNDCDIDIVDIMLVVVHWGETC